MSIVDLAVRPERACLELQQLISHQGQKQVDKWSLAAICHLRTALMESKITKNRHGDYEDAK